MHITANAAELHFSGIAIASSADPCNVVNFIHRPPFEFRFRQHTSEFPFSKLCVVYLGHLTTKIVNSNEAEFD